MRVLITGGAGFVGSHLAEHMLASGREVRVLDSFATGRRENLAAIWGDIELVEGDVQDAHKVREAVRGCEVVLHQAALPSVPRSVDDPVPGNAANVAGTLNVLQAARERGARRVVFASSSSVYGDGAPLPTSERVTPAPISPYAVGKLAGEGYCRTFHHVYGLETVALRYFNVFGPRQDPSSRYAAVIPSFISSVLGGRSPKVFGDGEQSRDFTFVEDVVHANRLALEAPGVAGKAFNVACGGRITLNQVLSDIAQITGRQADARYLPPRPGDVLHSHASIERAASELGYHPRVSFREGLRRTIEHLAAREGTAVAA